MLLYYYYVECLACNFQNLSIYNKLPQHQRRLFYRHNVLSVVPVSILVGIFLIFNCLYLFFFQIITLTYFDKMKIKKYTYHILIS